ncbi:MAG: Gfo/Idh/MocA family oxidoreductase [Oligosphaeraceae bacterium]|nr:Gfo/Idh/MocA family oxidoreductase [Oligosphaeraceae bacterium]
MTRRLRVGVIGQGRSGRDIHCQFLVKVPEKFEIVAVVDEMPDRCERAKQEYGCEAFQDYRELINNKELKLDFIINASFSHMHYAITKEIMEGGHHVLCEKPLARRAEEVHDLIAVSKRYGRILAIYQQSRFAPYYRQVCEVINSGVLGQIHMIKCAFNSFARRYDWQTLQSYNAGNLFNTGPHPMDQVLGFIGRDIMPNVWCRMAAVNTLGDAEDFCKVILSYPGRPVIDLEVCSNTNYSKYTYQVYGTYGSLSGTMDEIEWKYYKPEEAPELTLHKEPLPGPSYCKDTLTFHEGKWTVPDSDKDLFNSTAARFYNNLYDVLVNGATLIVTPEQVCQQIAVIEECHRQNPLPKLY